MWAKLLWLVPVRIVPGRDINFDIIAHLILPNMKLSGILKPPFNYKFKLYRHISKPFDHENMSSFIC